MEMTFCEKCRDDVTFFVVTEEVSDTLKGEMLKFVREKACCDKCKNEVFVADVEDRNLKALYDAYRQKQNIMPVEQIIEIPQKYNIGKRPLSLLLGWGETTFSRFCDGDMPTKQYSDILKKIYDEPEFYKSLLMSNKDNLKSILAYEKSMKRVQELMGVESEIESKIENIIHYVLYRCEDITPLALQKVLYYILGFLFAFEEKFLFTEDCEAWVHGPVYRQIYVRYAAYHFDPIKSIDEFDKTLFSASEFAIIDSIIRNFCCYSGKTLEAFTHLEKPWLKTRNGLPAGAPSDSIIDKDLIGAYFSAVKSKYCMLTPGDIESYSTALFKQIQ